MKIIDILEARYYRKHSSRDIVKRLKALAKVNTNDDVMVNDAWISPGSAWGSRFDRVEASFTITNTRTSEDVIDKVKLWLNDANIPYTQVIDLNDFEDGVWAATMRYDIKHLTEAKYYGKHSIDAVYKRLVNRANIQTDSRHKLMSYIYDVEMEEGAVKARVYLYDVDSEQQAISQAESLLHLHGIPFTDIGEGVQTGQRRWQVIMTYKPTENVTEARYHPHGEIDRKYTVYDPKTRKYPYTIILSTNKPKPSMIFATAEDATAKIKQLWDRMEHELIQISNKQQQLGRRYKDLVDDDQKYEALIRKRLSEINHYRIVEIVTKYVK